MKQGDSGARKSRGAFLDTVDNLTRLGLQLGGVVFVAASAYLLWAMVSGAVERLPSMAPQEAERIWSNLQFVGEAVLIAGLAVILSAAARFYAEEVTGYVLLIGGGALYWGIPMLAVSSIQSARVVGTAAASLGHIIQQFQFVGVVALVFAVPFILADFWYKLHGLSRSDRKRGAVTVKEEQAPKSRLYLFCWQMPYCRDYLRKFCKAYEQRKSCWRIKSGCYCDEDLILRVMKDKGGKAGGFDQRFTAVAGPKKQLTPAQKRERCRQCFLYQEHQRQKYRILSPLVFPLAVGLMWMYLQPVKAGLEFVLVKTDELLKGFSMQPAGANANNWASSSSISETVLWVFLICLGLIAITYLLRGLEYCIFDLQI